MHGFKAIALEKYHAKRKSMATFEFNNEVTTPEGIVMIEIVGAKLESPTVESPIPDRIV